MIGPWDHGGTQGPAKEIDGLAIPDAAVIDMKKLHAGWYDWALGRGPLPQFFHDRVAYFMMGANEWRYASTLEGAASGKEMVLYLSRRRARRAEVFHSGTARGESRRVPSHRHSWSAIRANYPSSRLRSTGRTRV